jgi:hypothetical protein
MSNNLYLLSRRRAALLCTWEALILTINHCLANQVGPGKGWKVMITISGALLHDEVSFHITRAMLCCCCSPSSLRGVFWDRKTGRWRSQLGYHNRKIFMGYFNEPEEAARAYDAKAVELHGAMGEGEEEGKGDQLQLQSLCHQGLSCQPS